MCNGSNPYEWKLCPTGSSSLLIGSDSPILDKHTCHCFKSHHIFSSIDRRCSACLSLCVLVFVGVCLCVSVCVFMAEFCLSGCVCRFIYVCRCLWVPPCVNEKNGFSHHFCSTCVHFHYAFWYESGGWLGSVPHRMLRAFLVTHLRIMHQCFQNGALCGTTSDGEMQQCKNTSHIIQ